MQSLRQIKNRIKSIENTGKVTGAMEMVSVAKYNRIDKALLAIRPYFQNLESIMNNLLGSIESAKHPLFEKSSEGKNKCLCVITSDGGLCGSYNANIIRFAEEFINKQNEEVKLIFIGKKGYNYFRSRNKHDALKSYIGLNGKYSEKVCNEITEYLVKIFLSGEVSEVYICYTYFQNTLVHKPVIAKLLNIDCCMGPVRQYIVEPDVDVILEEIIPKYIYMKMRFMFLEAFTSEHAARMVAMKAATDNAKDLLQRLVLFRNKVRQANITRDIMEIISSSEALKG